MAFRDISLEALKDAEGYSPFMEMSFKKEELRSNPDFAYRMLLKFQAGFRGRIVRLKQAASRTAIADWVAPAMNVKARSRSLSRKSIPA